MQSHCLVSVMINPWLVLFHLTFISSPLQLCTHTPHLIDQLHFQYFKLHQAPLGKSLLTSICPHPAPTFAPEFAVFSPPPCPYPHPFFFVFGWWGGRGARGGGLLPSDVSSSEIIRWLARLCCVSPHALCFENFQLRFLPVTCFFWFVFPLLLSGNGVLLENLTKTGAIGSINVWRIKESINIPPLLATHAHTLREKGTIELC